jgi:type I restriction enzyme S subunit
MTDQQGVIAKTDLFSGLVSSEELRQQYLKSGWLVSIPLSIIPAHWLHVGGQRLDAGYYANETVTASIVLKDSQFPVKTLKELGLTAYHPTQSQPRSNFKRILTTKENGTPFLSAGQMYDFRPATNKYLSSAMKKLPELMAPSGSLLMSRSGTVAIPLLVSDRISKYAVSDDSLRIFPGELPVGYLYAYLSSWIGRALVTKNQYGSTVKHLEGAHLMSTECPILPPQEQLAIHDAILKAYTLRDEANDLLDKANELLHSELGLPVFDESLVPYLSAPKNKIQNVPDLPHPKAFSIKASELATRFDGSYHIPMVRKIYELLKQGKYESVLLSKLTQNIHLPGRFKRLYVKKEYGVPFLRPSHLPQSRPFDLGYISHLTPTIESLRLHRGDVLISTDGTVGTIGLVTSRTDKWTGSNNIARITYSIADNRNGYLTAFLMTPYGYYQLTREIYGGVVDHIESAQIANIQIPEAPIPIQQKIGKLVVEAFEKKDEASAIEEAAIQQLEKRLEEAAKKI